MKMWTAVVLALSGLVIAPALANGAPTEDQQREACLGDVMRLCVAHVPNRARIQSCLGEHHQELSPQCRTVYDASVKAQRGSPRAQN